MPGSRSARSARSPAPRRCSTAGSRPCTRPSTPASWRGATSPSTCGRSPSTATQPIDLVVVNLYPFAATVASGAERETVIENIDIGGPTMIRAAAKNSDSVAVVVSPYPVRRRCWPRSARPVR